VHFAFFDIVTWRGFAMKGFPLIFTFKDVIAGNGYFAGVFIKGHVLMKNEFGEWWMYGVSPGAIAESGSTQEEANLKFNQAIRWVLSSFAQECTSFDEFQREVDKFVTSASLPDVAEWEEARNAVRAGSQINDTFIGKLERDETSDKPSVFVKHLEQVPKASDGYANPEIKRAA